METATRTNGNGQLYTLDLPKLIILDKFINDVAIKCIEKDTNLIIEKLHYGYTMQPVRHEQIVILLLKYNFKTQYHNNGSNRNTMFLRFCNSEGFKVDNICFDCCKENQIYTHDLKQGDRLKV